VGRGTVGLFEADPAADALLLERLDDRRVLRGLPLEQAAPIIGALLRRLSCTSRSGPVGRPPVASSLLRCWMPQPAAPGISPPVLWTRFDEMRDGARLRWRLNALVDAAGLDPVRARVWAILRAVDSCLGGLAVGFAEGPVRRRRIVEVLL
jgi:hypothetical protein